MGLDLNGNKLLSTSIGPKGEVIKTISTDGLLLYLDAGNKDSYPGSGTTWYDLSGNGLHSTLVNGPTFDSGQGGGIVFDGDNDRVTTPSFTYTPYSISVWLYNVNNINANDGAIGGPSTYQTLFSFGGGTAGVNLGGWTSAATNEAIHIWSTSGGALLTYTNQTVSFGVHNFVFNWNGSHYDIWVDGVKQNSIAGASGHAVLSTYTNVPLYLCTDTSTYEFNGKIYSFNLYGIRLTDTQVLQNFNASRSRFGI